MGPIPIQITTQINDPYMLIISTMIKGSRRCNKTNSEENKACFALVKGEYRQKCDAMGCPLSDEKRMSEVNKHKYKLSFLSLKDGYW